MATLRAYTSLAAGGDRPPVLLVHGAANSGRVWTFGQGWDRHRGGALPGADRHRHRRHAMASATRRRSSVCGRPR